MSKYTRPKKQAPIVVQTFDAWWKEQHGDIEDMLVPFIEEIRVLFQEAWEAGSQATQAQCEQVP